MNVQVGEGGLDGGGGGGGGGLVGGGHAGHVPEADTPTSAAPRLSENSFPRQLFTRCLFNSFLIECA